MHEPMTERSWNFHCEETLDCGGPCQRLWNHQGLCDCGGLGEHPHGPILSAVADVVISPDVEEERIGLVRRFLAKVVRPFYGVWEG